MAPFSDSNATDTNDQTIVVIKGGTDNTSIGNTTDKLKVDGSGVTQPISATALPLPSGASTSALQTTGNTSVASIDTKTPALGQALAAASVPVVLPAAQITTLTPLTSVTVTQATGTNLHTVVDSSALPSGASTAALQTTGNSSLSSIDTKITTTANGVKVDGSAVIQPVSAASLPLPTGAATSALQSTINTSLSTISTNQTNATQKTQIVDGAGTVAGTFMDNNGVKHIPVYQPLDVGMATQNVTTLDVASITGTGFGNQTQIIGTPTAGSAASFSLNSIQTVMVEVTGLWTGTLSTEISSDGGTVWVPRSIHLVGTSLFVASITSSVVGSMNASAKTNVRVRATAAITGTAVIRILYSDNPSNMYIANGIKLQDASSPTSTVQGTIKAASTASAATDTSLVVALSPNSPLGTGTNSIGQVTANAGTNLNTSALSLSANQTNGTQKTQVVDASGNVQPSGDVTARSLFVRITDGVDAAEVKAASTAAVASDPSLVVALSPNTPLPPGTNVIGSFTTGRVSLTANAPTAASVGVASGVVIATNSSRKGLVLTNTSNNIMSFGLGSAAVLRSGITLFPGGQWVMDEFTFTTAAINGIASAASSNVAIEEFQ